VHYFKSFTVRSLGHVGFEYRNRRVILDQQARHDLEFPKIQSENCPHGRESPGSKDLTRVNLNILQNSAFGCPTHDLPGFSLRQSWKNAKRAKQKKKSNPCHSLPLRMKKWSVRTIW
jgi:hypothetical protein